MKKWGFVQHGFKASFAKELKVFVNTRNLFCFYIVGLEYTVIKVSYCFLLLDEEFEVNSHHAAEKLK